MADLVTSRSRPYRVLYGEPIPPDLAELARSVLPLGFELTVAQSTHLAALLPQLREVDFLVVATTRVDEAVVRAAPRLRLVQAQGVGYDNIDVAACRRAGVPVAITPEGTSVGVAEHVVLLALALLKKLCVLDRAVRAGSWPVWQYRSSSYELAGKTMGIVGLGRIGRELASRANAFRMTVVYYDQRRIVAKEEGCLHVSHRSLRTLLAESDIVSLHLPLTPETKGLVDASFLASMKQTAILINTARGALVDENALVNALDGKVIAGAGLDVLSDEPPDLTNRLLLMENVIITPHVAAGTRDAFLTKLRTIFANMQRVADGQPPQSLVALSE
jgi:phosphoglycerate dehydrogenase-like enzyme